MTGGGVGEERFAGGPDVGTDDGDGSIMMVVATDAPLDSRNLTRLARRALAGLARTGSSMTSGSGDYVIAFSTTRVSDLLAGAPLVGNNDVSPLFQAVIEATERGHRGTSEALPLDQTIEILRRYGVVRP
jgi:D-aminopeptidase